MTNATKKATAQPPVAKLRIGLMTASIWQRKTETATFHSVTFERRYRDAQGAWQTTHSYDGGDLLVLAKLADQAHTRITQLAGEAE